MAVNPMPPGFTSNSMSLQLLAPIQKRTPLPDPGVGLMNVLTPIVLMMNALFAGGVAIFVQLAATPVVSNLKKLVGNSSNASTGSYTDKRCKLSTLLLTPVDGSWIATFW